MAVFAINNAIAQQIDTYRASSTIKSSDDDKVQMRPVEQRPQIRDIFELPKTSQQIQRFEGLRGVRPFILDRSGLQVLFRYERGGEVLLLKPIHTTRGDTVFKNDQGMVLLRLRRVGSATLFPKASSQGIVAWTTGGASKLIPPEISLQKMQKSLRFIANDLASDLDRDIIIKVQNAKQNTAWVFLDAAQNTRTAIQQILRTQPQNSQILQIHKIIISPAAQPAIKFENNTILISIAPERGFAGRLSSLQTQKLLTTGMKTIEPNALLEVNEPAQHLTPEDDYLNTQTP